MKGLRFCFVTTFYPPHSFGGDALCIQRFARALVRRGHHVTVIHDVDAYRLLSGGADPTPDPEPPGLEVVRLESRLGRVSSLLTQQFGRPVVNGGRIREILRRGRFDVVNFHNVSLVGGPGILSFGGDAVRVYTAHEHWLVCPMHVLWRHGRELCTGRECVRCSLNHGRPPQLYRYTGFMERQLCEVDAYIALSEFSRDKHAEFGFQHAMEVVPCFLPDPGRWEEGVDPPPHPRPYFLFVGRLEKIKGLDEVIPLFRGYDGADLLVAGDGDHASDLRAAAEGVPGVHFLGRVPPSELAAYYRGAVAVLVPSVCFETFGIIIIEAFSHGTPVIARRLGPFPELVEKAGGGLLFSTTEELLQAMERVREEPGFRDTLGRRGRAAFEDHWVEDAVLPRYLKVVGGAAERRGRSDVAAASFAAARAAGGM